MGKARAFFLILFLFALSGFYILWSQQGGEGAVTVYVTNSGTKYHLETCSSLSRSKIAITLTDALGSGYEACLICNPPPGAYPGTGAPPPRQRSGLYRVNTGKLPAFAAADRSRMVQAEVVDHVDGDTVRVRVPNPPSGLNVVETIRMLGVDTPETVHPGRPVERFGREAGSFTRQTLLNRTVYLAFDWDLRDRYGRLLAYIYTADGDCFNAALIREGYGYAYTRYPFQFMEEFRSLEQEARSARRGLWNSP